MERKMKKKLKYLIRYVLYKRILKRDLMELKVQYYRDMGVKIGSNMRTFSPLTSAEPYLLEFKDEITISSDVKFITHDNATGKAIPEATDSFGKITIGNNCFIGLNSIILPGVELADDIIVGAGSVVTKSFLQEGVVIAGNPARVVTTVEKYRDKYRKYAMNRIGLSAEEKKQMILNNPDKWIEK
ncbi:hypothetical protein COL13_25160 [Bacillus cereus]|nr:hypothetical protein COL13_25160 [Bacillus cereus]